MNRQIVPALLLLFACGCVPAPSTGPSRTAGEVRYQQDVSGYTGSTDTQKIAGLSGLGSLLRAEAGYDISDIPPSTMKNVAAVRGDRKIAAPEKTRRIEAMMTPRPVDSSFVVSFAMPGIPDHAKIASATVELTVASIKEPCRLHYEKVGPGDTSKIVVVKPGDAVVKLDVKEIVLDALMREKALKVTVRTGRGGVWFYGVRHRELAKRPMLRLTLASPVDLAAADHRLPEAAAFVAKDAMTDAAKLAALLDARPRLKTVKLYPAADAMVGSRSDPKGTYPGHANVDTNFGTAMTLNVRDWYPGFDWRSFIRFDLAPLEGRRIHGAIMGLYTLNCPNSKAEKVKAYATADEFDAWEEDAITWRDQPRAGNHYHQAPIDHQMVGPKTDKSTLGRWYHWDLGGYVDDEMARGNKVASLVIKEEYTSSHSLPIFASREAGPAKSPYLLVVYEGGDVKAPAPAIERPARMIGRNARMILDFEGGPGCTAVDMKKAPLKVAETGATRGRSALQAAFTGDNGGIYITLPDAIDLTTHRWFCFDVTWNAKSTSGFGFAMVIEDPDSAGKWSRNYHNEKLGLVPGQNTIRISTDAIAMMNVDPKRAKKMHFYWTAAAGVKPKAAALSFDAFRLEIRK